MFSGNGIAPRIFCTDVHCNMARRPGLEVARRNTNLPATGGVDHGDIVDVIDGDGDLRACGQMAAGAGHGKILMLLNGIDHVITGKGVNAQTRQRRVDIDIALAAARIAVAVGD